MTTYRCGRNVVMTDIKIGVKSVLKNFILIILHRRVDLRNVWHAQVQFTHYVHHLTPIEEKDFYKIYTTLHCSFTELQFLSTLASFPLPPLLVLLFHLPAVPSLATWLIALQSSYCNIISFIPNVCPMNFHFLRFILLMLMLDQFFSVIPYSVYKAANFFRSLWSATHQCLDFHKVFCPLSLFLKHTIKHP